MALSWRMTKERAKVELSWITWSPLLSFLIEKTFCFILCVLCNTGIFSEFCSLLKEKKHLYGNKKSKVPGVQLSSPEIPADSHNFSVFHFYSWFTFNSGFTCLLHRKKNIFIRPIPGYQGIRIYLYECTNYRRGSIKMGRSVELQFFLVQDRRGEFYFKIAVFSHI